MPTATVAPPFDPVSAAAEGTRKDHDKHIPTIRSGLLAAALGESCDAKPFAHAVREEGMTDLDVSSHLEALKSCPDLDTWPDEFKRKMGEADAAEEKWRKAETEADLALTAARRNRRLARLERDNLIATDRQHRMFLALNPFLFSDNLDEAAAAATVPALTVSEVASIEAGSYPEAEARRVREQKIALRQQVVARNTNPNQFISKTNCDVRTHQPEPASYTYR